MGSCAYNWRAVGAAICLVAVAGVARPVRADGTGVIAVAGAGAADRAALVAAVTSAVGPGRRVVDAIAEARARLAAGAVPAASLAGFRRVREMVDDGWRAYLRVQIDVAQQRLAAAVAEAEPLVALPGGAELYADAMLRLGAVLLYRRAADAPGLFALAIAVDPARPVTLAEFSPDIVDAVEAVRAHPAARQPLRVEAEPAGARITVDGAEAGAAPLTLSVASGQHLVFARAPLHRPKVALVRVDGAAGGSVRVALDRDEPAAALAAGAEPGMAASAEQGLIDAALGPADLDDIVVAAVDDRRGEPALIMQRCAGQPARCTVAAEVGFADRAGLAAAAREAWRAVQAAPLGEPPGVLGQIRQPTQPSPGCEFCRKPVVLAGAAAIVIAAVVTIAALASSSRPPPVLSVDGHSFGR